MLEAQVSIKPDRAGGISRQGDIIVLALEGHPWGTLDRKHLLVVKWVDPAIERVLTDRRRAGEKFPIVTTPYALRERGKMVERSELQLDFTAIDPTVRALDPAVTKPILGTEEYAVKAAAADDVIESAGLVQSAVNFVKSAWKWMVG